MPDEVPLVRVMALHALAYCERLFYLEEVEEIRLADHRVYAGRTLHAAEVEGDGPIESITLESESWGIRGQADFIRYRDGGLVVYEHKRGRAPDEGVWPSDRLQLIAYAALVGEHFDTSVAEGRVRYHASNRTVSFSVGEPEHAELRAAVFRARELAAGGVRPPVASNERLCAACSLAPVCLPEEERFSHASADDPRKPVRLFPEEDERRTVHVLDSGARVGKSGEEIVVTRRGGEETRFPGRDVSSVVLHGNAQVTTQLIHFAVANDIAIHWLTGGGQYVAGVMQPGGVQRRIRQFEGLRDAPRCLDLARRVAAAKIANQMRFVIRSGRGRIDPEVLRRFKIGMTSELRALRRAAALDQIRGHEGMAARHYFAILPELIDSSATLMKFSGRTRRPPGDPFNAALSFGYSLLYRDAVASVVTVGLDPSFGFLHQPRSAAYPLALDLMELFRTVLWEMPLVASVNRRQWTEEHVTGSRGNVWLTPAGRRQAIAIYEARKSDCWRHPVLEYSLSYGRTIELEARLLEKEWSGRAGLFARSRLRG